MLCRKKVFSYLRKGEESMKYNQKKSIQILLLTLKFH